MSIFFFIPPSEGKNIASKYTTSSLSFPFVLPLGIAQQATEKDLKCTGARYKEGISFNTQIMSSSTLDAIHRYTGVMFGSIDYDGLSNEGQIFFNTHFLIVSGMYGLLQPTDTIGNYKLPIETKGLYGFWGDILLQKIIDLQPKYIINLLPGSYEKVIGLSDRTKKEQVRRNRILESGICIVDIDFVDTNGKKYTHGVKTIKGKWIHEICERNVTDPKDFGGKIEQNLDGSLQITLVV